MGDFETRYLPLSLKKPQWGEVGCLSWDEAVFGFPVAQFRVGLEPPTSSEVAPFRAALEEFAAASQAELISVRFDALNRALMEVFCKAGFIPVDLAEEASYTRPRLESMPKARFGVRLAEPDDYSDICRIAGSAFQFGR